MTQALKDIVINALEEIKATDIVDIDVRELTGMMDHMIVASGNSNRQVKSLANSVVVDAKEAGYNLIGVEGDDTAEWILVDFGDVIVHIMLPAGSIIWTMTSPKSTRIHSAVSSPSTPIRL